MEFKDYNSFGVFEVKKIGLNLFPEKQDYIRCANRTEIVNLFIESNVTFDDCKAALNNKSVSPKVAPAIVNKVAPVVEPVVMPEPVKVIPVVEPEPITEPIKEIIQPIAEPVAVVEPMPEPAAMPKIEMPVIETIEPLPAAIPAQVNSEIDIIRDILLKGFKPVEQVPAISMIDVERMIDIKLQEFEVRQKLQFTEMLKTMLAVIQ
jgi:hypothetical protein